MSKGGIVAILCLGSTTIVCVRHSSDREPLRLRLLILRTRNKTHAPIATPKIKQLIAIATTSPVETGGAVVPSVVPFVELLADALVKVLVEVLVEVLIDVLKLEVGVAAVGGVELEASTGGEVELEVKVGGPFSVVEAPLIETV